MPVFGLSDVNTNPFNLSLFVVGNDDSYDNIMFFLKLLEETTYEGRQQEQELFFHLIFFELHKILENEII
jgi:ribosomal protein S2